MNEPQRQVVIRIPRWLQIGAPIVILIIIVACLWLFVTREIGPFKPAPTPTITLTPTATVVLTETSIPTVTKTVSPTPVGQFHNRIDPPYRLYVKAREGKVRINEKPSDDAPTVFKELEDRGYPPRVRVFALAIEIWTGADGKDWFKVKVRRYVTIGDEIYGFALYDDTEPYIPTVTPVPSVTSVPSNTPVPIPTLAPTSTPLPAPTSTNTPLPGLVIITRVESVGSQYVILTNVGGTRADLGAWSIQVYQDTTYLGGYLFREGISIDLNERLILRIGFWLGIPGPNEYYWLDGGLPRDYGTVKLIDDWGQIRHFYHYGVRPSPTPTVTRTATVTPLPTNTPTVTQTLAPTNTSTVTFTQTPVPSPTVTSSATLTVTPTASETPISTGTATSIVPPPVPTLETLTPSYP